MLSKYIWEIKTKIHQKCNENKKNCRQQAILKLQTLCLDQKIDIITLTDQHKLLNESS